MGANTALTTDETRERKKVAVRRPGPSTSWYVGIGIVLCMSWDYPSPVYKKNSNQVYLGKMVYVNHTPLQLIQDAQVTYAIFLSVVPNRSCGIPYIKPPYCELLLFRTHFNLLNLHVHITVVSS